MQTYLSTKIVKATPMSRIEYIDYRGWELPADENGADDGYLVEDTDGGNANHKKHKGYICWSPKERFEKSHKLLDNKERSEMTFGEALELVKKGGNIQRKGWNGKGMFVFLARTDGVDPYFIMRTAQKTMQPGWLASQADMLAEDWLAITDEEVDRVSSRS